MKKVFWLSILFIAIIKIACTDAHITKPDIEIPFDTSLKMIFVELGADNCIPCLKMRPVMDSIQKKYGSQIYVKFINARKNPAEAVPFKIRLIPTQIFLDTNSKEILRHEGFFPEDSIHIFLQANGLKILDESE
jgi:thiol-disulfide isomerase/thioredoxin